MKAAALWLTLVLPAAASAETLDLVCHGTARSTEATQTFGSISADGETANGSATTYRRARSEETLRIHLDEGGVSGKVKLPRPLIPRLSGGRDGWWDFVKIDVSDDKIRGQLSLNPLNHPKIVIDRRTGDIDLTEFGGSFSGSCEKAPDEPEARKF